MTPSFLSSEFQLPFPKQWLRRLEKDEWKLFEVMQEGRDTDEESQDPAAHPSFYSMMEEIDPEMLKVFQKKS